MGRVVRKMFAVRGLRQVVAAAVLVGMTPALNGCSGTPPTASFTVSPNPARVGQSVTFDASASTPGERGENCYAGNIIEHYDWDFDGDGTTDVSTTGPIATHTYSSAGVDRVTLTVTNTCHLSDSDTQVLTVFPASASSARGAKTVHDGSVARPAPATRVRPARPPVNLGAPGVYGVAKVGERLTARRGPWKGRAPIRFDYQWKRCAANGRSCVSIVGGSGRQYTVKLADLGSRLRVVVTARNRDGIARAPSDATEVVIPGVAVPSTPGSKHPALPEVRLP
jgi:PKD repeat protein